VETKTTLIQGNIFSWMASGVERGTGINIPAVSLAQGFYDNPQTVSP
jgi:hypothetical protein